MEITIHIPAMDKLADAIAHITLPPQPRVASPVTASQTPVTPPQTPAAPPVSPVVTPPPQVPAAAQQPAQGNVVPMPAAPTPAPTAVPVQQPGAFTYEQLQKAAGELVAQQRQGELVALLAKYGVPGMNQLSEAQYGAFATDLRALGAKI